MTENNEQPENEKEKKGTIGKAIATLGVAMLCVSIILVFAGVSGKLLHNILQLGGIGTAVIGFIVWKVIKV